MSHLKCRVLRCGYSDLGLVLAPRRPSARFRGQICWFGGLSLWFLTADLRLDIFQQSVDVEFLPTGGKETEILRLLCGSQYSVRRFSQRVSFCNVAGRPVNRGLGMLQMSLGSGAPMSSDCAQLKIPGVQVAGAGKNLIALCLRLEESEDYSFSKTHLLELVTLQSRLRGSFQMSLVWKGNAEDRTGT
jgi:hypothetical protein